MKKLILLLACFTMTLGQYHDVIENFTGIKTPDNGNPAWISKKHRGNIHSYEIKTDFEQGDLKLPFTPEKSLDINYIASGEKQLFGSGVFSGYVSYHQQNLSNKFWIHNRNPYQGFPFLLADSSEGDIKLNGIHWQLGYSHEILKDRLFVGTRLFYNVDEEMKQVFPKPINKHRDMVFSLGIGSILTENLELGFTWNYFDFQEILKTGKYSMEQARNPIFFKIRGLDNPLIFRGTSSVERDMDFIGNSLQLDGKIRDFFFKELDFVAGFENCDAEAVDGGAYPVNQGTMTSDELYFSMSGAIALPGKSEWKFFSHGNALEQISDHPDIAIEVFEYRRKQVVFGTGLQFLFFDHLTLQPGIFGSSQYLKRVDKFNGILEYYPSQSLGEYLTLDIVGFKKFSWYIYYDNLSGSLYRDNRDRRLTV